MVGARDRVVRPADPKPLSPDEAKLLEEVALTRRPTFWARFMQGFAYATGTISRAEFDRVCHKVIEELDGKVIDPDVAAAKAQRLIAGYTQAQAGVMVPKCDYSDQAILVAYLGDPKSGFLFQKALRLKDPRGVKRA